MLFSVCLDRDRQLDGGVAVDAHKLVVLELDDVAVLLGDHAGHAHEHARAIGQKDAHGEDAAALDQAVLDDGAHGDDVHVAARENAHDALVLGRQVLGGGHGEKAGVLDHHLVVLDHVKEAHDQLFVLDGDDVVEVLLQVG